MSLKWQSEGINAFNGSKLENNIRMHSENNSEELSNIEERKLQIELSSVEERKLQIDEDGNRPSIIEEEDRYQLPDTQNRELQQSTQNCDSDLHSTQNGTVHTSQSEELHSTQNSELHSTQNNDLHCSQSSDSNHRIQNPLDNGASRINCVPMPIHMPENRPQLPLVGEPQLHVHEMSSTVTSPGL